MYSCTPRWAGILLGLLLLAAGIAACLREPAATEDTAESQSPTAVPPPTAAPAESAMSPDSYADQFCGESDSEELENITYGQLAAELTAGIEIWASVEPPQEFAAWHQAFLSYMNAQMEALDDHQGAADDPVSDAFFIDKLMPAAMQLNTDLANAIAAMDPEARALLAAAGCPVDQIAAAADDAWTLDGDDVSDMQELTVGADAAGTLEEPGASDHYYFHAEEGRTYLIEAQWEGLTSVSVELSDGLTFAKIRERSKPPFQFEWTAPAAGQYTLYITAGAGSGSYTLSVSFDGQTVQPAETPAPASTRSAAPTAESAAAPSPTPAEVDASAQAAAPANLLYAFEGAAIRLTWDAAPGADYYNVYYDDFLDSACRVDAEGRPSFCDALALNVAETTYLHADPSGDRNFYWVVACNQQGCSEVDSQNPARPAVERPAAPQATYVWEGTAIRVSWAPVAGADHYNVYYDDFFGSACRVNADGSSSFCDVLALNVTETAYLHADPDEDQNFYWVNACNRGGCSEVDGDNPAVQGESGATGTAPPVADKSESAAADTGKDESTATAHAADRAALVAIYNALDGPNWLDNNNWLSDEPLQRWYGVTTDRSGRVSALRLMGNGLSGEFPPELGNLQFLRTLDLSQNSSLHGRIPAELGNLTNLEFLNLADQAGQRDPSHSLSGSIPPELGNLAKLRLLNLSFQELSGEIPPELGNLSSLTALMLQRNELSGAIPPQLGGMSNLRLLSLGMNRLSGAIPASLGSLSALTSLWLGGNELSGAIPSELGALAALESLNLSGNMLSGEIPPSLGSLTKLEALDLADNTLNGAIPSRLSGLAALQALDLSKNRLAGASPAELGTLPALQALDIRDNDLSGEIPEQLTDMWTLRIFFAGGNRFTGCIPFGLRIMMARTLGEQIHGFAARWLAIPGPGQRTDLDRLDIPYCKAPELYDAIRSNDAEKLRALIAAGADVNEEAPAGGSLLYGPIFRDHVEIVRILVEAGADVNAPMPDGRMLLRIAKFFQRTEIVQILLDAGANE